MTQKTIAQSELQGKINLVKQVPGLAHLPAFGLVLHNWDFADPELKAKAKTILENENIPYLAIEDVCQALFWYRDINNELHLHFWE